MRESFEDWQALGRDLISRGLGAPMLIVADGAPGLIKAIEQCWPASDRQRCCVHRARNLYAKLPDRERERVKHAYWQALDEAIIRGRRQAPAPGTRRPARQGRLHRRRPLPRRRPRRARRAPALPSPAPPHDGESTNLLERSLGEVKRRTKVMGRFPGETSCLTLVWAVLDLLITHQTNGINFNALDRQRLKRARYQGNEQTIPEEVTAA